MVGVLALCGCSSSKTSGLLSRMSKFDITTASPDDIAKALKEDGCVAISGGFLFEADSATLAPSAADVVTRIADMMKDPNLKLAVVGHTDNTGDFNYNLQVS
jgi:outer membrane protein OmpA-like peptidoglycan-associated protein